MSANYRGGLFQQLHAVRDYRERASFDSFVEVSLDAGGIMRGWRGAVSRRAGGGAGAALNAGGAAIGITRGGGFAGDGPARWYRSLDCSICLDGP